MKKLLITSSLLCLLTSSTLYANNLCLAVTNYSPDTVESAGLVDPGYTYTINPQQTIKFSGDMMAGSCPNNLCTIWVNDHVKGTLTWIENIPRGSYIVYGGNNSYYVDRDANVACDY